MGDYKKHLRIAQEKLEAVRNAFVNDQHTVVGDLATKVIEHLLRLTQQGRIYTLELISIDIGFRPLDIPKK